MGDTHPTSTRAAWTPYDEERLKQAKRSAGWRWIGYAAVLIGLVFLPMALVEWSDAKADGEAVNPLAFFGLPVFFFVLGLIVALPAEKAAKQAKLLRVQKRDAQEAPA